MIADRLDTEDLDDTCLGILHLLVSELGSYNESTFEIHIQGLNQLANGARQLAPRSTMFMMLYVYPSTDKVQT